ncbi:MAG: hypothetical protein ABIO44_01015, partial [Saprospiraceae bacterium]
MTFIKTQSNKDYKSRFLGLLIFGLILVIIGRIYETLALYFCFNPAKLWKSEALGLFQDILLCLGIFSLLFPLYKKLFTAKEKNKLFIFDVILVILCIAHLVILEYFFYQMEPLDVFVLGHTPSEMAFSLNTSSISFKRLFIGLIVTILILIIGLYYSKKLNVNSSRIRSIRIFGFIGLIVFFLIDTFGKIPVASDLIKCKSYYFYANILKHGTNKMFDLDIPTFANKYQEEFSGKDYISKDYPFLHKFENENKLGNYLNSFERSPNIMVLITESLSEYFIHPIRGIEFMPFLDSLSKASLYWPNHLSVGERSFAVNPAINAAVPYGETGFSLLEVYPYHFSLVNILKKNNYYTSFYYGQGSWFHNKNHFYTFNNIDRIIDKNVFDTIFEKVLVGDEKNFWGFNDLDLFNQYL